MSAAADGYVSACLPVLPRLQLHERGRALFGSNYHSLQASLQKRFSRGSLVSVAYTFSKAMTDSPGDRWNGPQNTYDIRANYGPSPLDRKHILTASLVYELPWMRSQQGLVGDVLGGWGLSSIVAFNGGVPATVTSAQYMDHLGLARPRHRTGLRHLRPGRERARSAQSATGIETAVLIPHSFRSAAGHALRRFFLTADRF